MRIAFFTDTFLPTTNGVVSSVVNFARGLSDLGHEVVIWAPSHSQLDLKKVALGRNVRVELIGSVNGRIYHDLRVGVPNLKTYREVKRFGPDVVHVFTPLTVGMLGVVAGKRLRTPLVFSHGTKFEHREMLRAVRLVDVSVVGAIQRTGVGRITNKFFNLFDVVTVASGDTERDVKRIGGGVKIRRVKMPVPVGEFRDGRKKGVELREGLGIKRAIIFVGRLSGEKRLDVLMGVYSKLVGEFGDLRLVLVGGGPERKRLFDLAAELRVGGGVIWIGEKVYGDLIREGIYYLGDIAVMLSQIETQGLSSVEAMACGLVVVGSNKGATSEVIGDAGLLVNSRSEKEVASAVAKLLRDKKLMARMRKKALKRAEEFSIERCSKKLDRVYEGLVEE